MVLPEEKFETKKSEIKPKQRNIQAESDTEEKETKIDALLDESRALVYSSRFAAVMRTIPKIMEISRPMAYASELGESFRSVVSPKFVRFMYGISWAYVTVDTVVKTYEVKDHGIEKMAYTFGDTALWHSLASMVKVFF